MKTTFLFLLFSISIISQNSYKTKSGVIYKVGDTIRIGQPLSHLGWISIMTTRENEDYIKNKNLIDKDVVIKRMETVNDSVSFVFEFYKKEFILNIDHAIQNKEVIPQFARALTKVKSQNKYTLLLDLKKLLDENIRFR